MSKLRAIFLLLLVLLNENGVKVMAYLRRALQSGDDAPVYPVVIDSGVSDPLLENLIIPNNAAVAGMWSRLETWPIVSIHTAVMPDGKLVSYGSPTDRGVQDGRIFVFWDPTKGIGPDSRTISPNAQGVDSFCSSGTSLSDGSFLTSGGAGGSSGASSRESSILDYRTQTARRAADLTFPRWYGTMTKLPDGRAIMTGGSRPYVVAGWQNPVGQAEGVSSTPEIYTEGQGWSILSGGFSLDAFGAEGNRYWYPRQWVTPVGTLFGISTDRMWELQFNTRNGSIRTLGNFKTKPNPTGKPNVGPTSTAVMYDTGKIIQMGGNGHANGEATPSSNLASIFDITNIASTGVTVRETSSMRFPRQWANSVVLSDGKVLVTGGTQFADDAGGSAVYAAEIWNPNTGDWTLGAEAAVYRGYHSTTALLPNGAAFSSGGGVPGPVTNFNAEIYFPPYFFQRSGARSVLASRPKIISISSNSLKYGDRINIQVSAGNNAILEVALSAVPMVTHSFDSNQRRMKLVFQSIATGVRATIPTSANLAPPGYYYLVVVNDQGIPSPAAIVGINSAAPPIPAPRIPTAPTNAPIDPASLIEDITGAFEATVRARFDSPNDRNWQRIFDFGNGAAQDNVWLGQRANTNDMVLEVWRAGAAYQVVAPGSIVPGELAIWRVGVDPDSIMWIEKNGNRLAQASGALPRNVVRINKFIGKSNWAGDAPLTGAVLGLDVTNVGEASDNGLLNIARQITGAFTAEVVAQYNNPNGRQRQRVFDFGNGPGRDNIWFGQESNTNDMVFAIWRDGVEYRAIAPQSISPGELATWRVGVDTDGIMWIEKNGVRLVQTPGRVPANIIRANMYFGDSNWEGDANLDGIVLGFGLILGQGGQSPTSTPQILPSPTNKPQVIPSPTSIPTKISDVAPRPFGTVEDIRGAFEATVRARFDSLNDRNWQRIFDFGNGAAQDNVWLGQRANTNDMVLEVWRAGTAYRVVAPGSIVPGELAIWRVGVDPDAIMWIEKNGNRLAQASGALPRNVVRMNKLIGKSNWAGDAPLTGAVLGLDVTNVGEASDNGLLNIAQQITGAFTAEVVAQYNNPNGRQWQRVFDFGNGPGRDNIWFGQESNTNDMVFAIWRDGVEYRAIAPQSISPGELATWRVGVDTDGIMWIEKNGVRLVQTPGRVPANIVRTNMYFGDSNWEGDANLDGIVLGFGLILGQGGQSPTSTPQILPSPTNKPQVIPSPTSIPTKTSDVALSPFGTVEDIRGALEATVRARFDSLNDRNWQCIFDFGNGAAQDNVWLGQRADTDDMVLEVWSAGTAYRVVAPGSIVPGELAIWRVGVDPDAIMWIEKNGNRLAQASGALPRNVVRMNKFIGKSNWAVVVTAY